MVVVVGLGFFYYFWIIINSGWKFGWAKGCNRMNLMKVIDEILLNS